MPAQQLLLERDEPVAIGARALDLLIVLTGRPGEVVTKNELMAHGWPGTFVDESNVRVHIAGLRRALQDGVSGNRYIVNVAGRGYSFVAPVEIDGDGEAPAEPEPERTSKLHDIPVSASRLIGRTAIVEALCAQLAQRRFVTLVGPGGIGKTTVAVAVARELAPAYRDGVCFVDFSSISDPQLVPATVAAALGLAVPSRDAMPAIIAHLGRRNLLLVLDSCEHVIETAANAAEQVSSISADVHVLSTSREPLRAAGERVHRLPPLESPSTSAGLTADEALTFPCIELFVERVAAVIDGFRLTDADAPVVADICRRLDGIALAIELAAGRVLAFGLRELAARLDDRFRLLTGGRRTALPRHQTLLATLEWSYDLLPAPEQMLLRRLAIFAGEFSVDGAIAVMTGESASRVLGLIADLVSKSLVVADTRTDAARYRLLDTTRLYGAEKLGRDDDLGLVRRSHAEHVRGLFASAEAEAETLPTSTWIAKYVRQLDNVRAALDWAGSADGDPEMFVHLAVAAVPLWVHLSLMSECRARVEQALGMLAGEDARALQFRLRLTAARGWSLMYAAGRASEIGATWTAALDLANRLDDASYRLRAIWGIWISKLNTGDLRAALGLAQQLLDLVDGSADETDLMMAERLMATTLHYRGDQASARVYMERMFARYAIVGNQPKVAPFHVNQQVTARYFLARILWLQGDVDQALEAVRENIEEGHAIGHALTFASVLGQAACPLALLTGDLPTARRYGSMLLEHSQTHALHLWHDWARGFDGLVTIKEGDIDAGLHVMRAAFDKAGDSSFLPRYMMLLGEFAAASGRSGRTRQGLETLAEILVRCDRSEERWYVPELLRMQGELLLLAGKAASALEAEARFTQAIALAAEQGARSWQLRAGISLARLRSDAGDRASARAEIAGIHSQFTEGFATADLLEAERLLAEL